MSRHPEGTLGTRQDAVREDVVTIEAGTRYAFTDGSTWRSNPGPIAWSVVFVEEGHPEGTRDGRRQALCVGELTGAHAEGTNNVAELMAVVWALEHERLRDLVVVTDSILIYNLCRGTWRARSHRDLYARFERALAVRQRRGLATDFRIVKGHNKDPWNRRADQLARAAAEQAHGHLAVPAREREGGLAAVPPPIPVEVEETSGNISHEAFLTAHRAAEGRRRNRRSAA